MTKPFVKLLKEHTVIDHKFIDTFFTDFKIGEELDFHIADKDVAAFTGIDLESIRVKLQNKFTKTKKFYENVDYIIKKSPSSNQVKYMLNYPCFEKLAMSGNTKECEQVREYFVKLRLFLYENQHLIFQSMEIKKDLSAVSKYETIYFFAADSRKESVMFKVGRTGDIVKRLKAYNVGRIPEVDLRYLAVVRNSNVIEKCMVMKLKKHQIAGKEIFHTDFETIKKTVDECYKKHTTKAENEKLHQDLNGLIGLLTYIKGKTHIKPYVIISNETPTDSSS